MKTADLRTFRDRAIDLWDRETKELSHPATQANMRMAEAKGWSFLDQNEQEKILQLQARVDILEELLQRGIYDPNALDKALTPRQCQTSVVIDLPRDTIERIQEAFKYNPNDPSVIALKKMGFKGIEIEENAPETARVVEKDSTEVNRDLDKEIDILRLVGISATRLHPTLTSSIEKPFKLLNIAEEKGETWIQLMLNEDGVISDLYDPDQKPLGKTVEEIIEALKKGGYFDNVIGDNE